jgi:hypothetical protein
LDVLVQVHIGLEDVAGSGDPPDYLMGLGLGFLFGGGNFLGQLAEAVDGRFPGEPAPESVDLAAQLRDGHGYVSFSSHEERLGGAKGKFYGSGISGHLGAFWLGLD